VQAAQAEVGRAKAAVEKAKADLDLAYVRSPRDGRVLKIHARPGEVVSKQEEGILKLGQTDQMYAVAEVYETKPRLVKCAWDSAPQLPVMHLLGNCRAR